MMVLAFELKLTSELKKVQHRQSIQKKHWREIPSTEKMLTFCQNSPNCSMFSGKKKKKIMDYYSAEMKAAQTTTFQMKASSLVVQSADMIMSMNCC